MTAVTSPIPWFTVHYLKSCSPSTFCFQTFAPTLTSISGMVLLTSLTEEPLSLEKEPKADNPGQPREPERSTGICHLLLHKLHESSKESIVSLYPFYVLLTGDPESRISCKLYEDTAFLPMHRALKAALFTKISLNIASWRPFQLQGWNKAAMQTKSQQSHFRATKSTSVCLSFLCPSFIQKISELSI